MHPNLFSSLTEGEAMALGAAFDEILAKKSFKTETKDKDVR